MTERKTIYEESTAFVNEYVDRVPKPLKNLFLILFSGHNILFLFFFVMHMTMIKVFFIKVHDSSILFINL